jgi:hypothetical protein
MGAGASIEEDQQNSHATTATAPITTTATKTSDTSGTTTSTGPSSKAKAADSNKKNPATKRKKKNDGSEIEDDTALSEKIEGAVGEEAVVHDAIGTMSSNHLLFIIFCDEL